ncbi:lipase family protein [Gordonia jinhuaensis]|uniref:Inactive lipase n=1 Tax=Gordonia jinhuaensis TaxID=1517702 RepID=A0A916TBX7_9ACTN|nr:lipase family protein [Gordonia jinhuaensis]GGB36773.1 putative inactive lipase [Gordonia jinhuaensis]
MRVRSMVTALACAALVGLGIGVPAGVAEAAPSDTPVRTPALGEVFNGYVVGTFRDGRVASPGEVISPLTSGDAFYNEPTLTGDEKPGTLLKSKPVAVQFTGFRPGNVRAYKLMYVTTGADDKPAISTGLLMIPQDGRKDADRALVGYQMANDSVGAYCHPSTMWTGGDPLDGSSWSALGPLAQMLGKGDAVFFSDVGISGDRKPHGVFAGKFSGHANLDGLRAVSSIRGTGLNPKPRIGLFGIAGGGVGSGFAAELAPTYAPELDIKATVLEGMVINQRNFMRTADGSVGSGFAFATLLGLEPWYPQMKLDEKLTPAGKALADAYRTQCQTPAYFTLPFVPLKALFKNGQSPADIADFQPVFDDNLLGRGTPKSKVLITSCRADDSPMSLVPAKDSRDLAAGYRKRGVDVSYQPSDCSMTQFLTNLYGWGPDLFGMQTADWFHAQLKS